MFKFKKNFARVGVDIDFIDSIVLVEGDSACGKTLLGKTLQSYYTISKGKIAYQYYDDKTIQDLNIDRYNVIVFDNAHYYLDMNLVNKINSYPDKTFIFFGRGLHLLLYTKAKRYKIYIEDKIIKSKKL